MMRHYSAAAGLAGSGSGSACICPPTHRSELQLARHEGLALPERRQVCVAAPGLVGVGVKPVALQDHEASCAEALACVGGWGRGHWGGVGGGMRGWPGGEGQRGGAGAEGCEAQQGGKRAIRQRACVHHQQGVTPPPPAPGLPGTAIPAAIIPAARSTTTAGTHMSLG